MLGALSQKRLGYGAQIWSDTGLLSLANPQAAGVLMRLGGLEAWCSGQMIGVRMGFQDHDDPPVVCGGERQDALGRMRIRLAARRIEIQYRVDDRGFACRRFGDEVADGVGRLIEERFTTYIAAIESTNPPRCKRFNRS